MQSARLVFLLIACSSCVSASAAMYRWVDENGVTVYSQSPPTGGDAVELKKQSQPSVSEVEAARERLRRQRERTFDEAEARKASQAEREKQNAEEAQRAENCEAARKNLELYRNLGPRRVRMPDGRVVRPTEDDVKVNIEQAQAQIETYCDR